MGDIKSTMDPQKQVNINIYKQNNDNATDSSQAYIIMANEELNNQNKDFLNQLNRVQSEIEIIIEENEGHEKSITYQRGLLHNFNELNKLSDKRNNKLEDINNTCKEQLKEINTKKEKVYKLINYLVSSILLSFLFQSALGIIDITLFINICIILMGNVYIIKTYGDLNLSEDLLEDITKKYKEKRGLIMTNIKEINNKINEIK